MSATYDSYTWTIRFEEVSGLARPIIWLAAWLFGRAMAAQVAALTEYLERDRHRSPD